MSNTVKEKKQPSFGYALMTMIVCFAFVLIPTIFFKANIRVMFLLAWLLAYPLCMHLGNTFQELQSGMLKFIPKCIMAMLLLLTVGSVVGAWCASGTIAYVMSLGLSIINPKFFLATAFLVCLIFACMAGTSFGTCGTVGVALMGVAIGMGINELVAAACIISAALIGDGLSPMSDTPNVIAGTTGVDLVEAIKFQLPMTIPVAVLTFVYYVILGASGQLQVADTSTIKELIGQINDTYHMGPVCLIPIAIVLILLVLHFPTIPSLMLGAVSGALVAWLVQGQSLISVINVMYNGYQVNSDVELINSLFSRGGILNMVGTALLFIFSFGLFGILNECHILETLVAPLCTKVNGRFSGYVCTIILGFIALFSSSASFSEVFTCNIMKEVYEEKGMDLRDLTRAATVGTFALQLYIPYVLMVQTVCGYLNVDGIAVMRHYVTSPLYLIVCLIIVGFNLDKKFCKFLFKNEKEDVINVKN